MINNYLKNKNIEAIKFYDKSPEMVLKWKNFLAEFNITEDIYIQSLNKYKCRMFYFDWKYKIISNLAAFFKLSNIHLKHFFYNLLKKNYLDNLSKTKLYKSNLNTKQKNKIDMIIQSRTDLGIDDVFPDRLYSEFPSYKIIPANFERDYIFNKELKKTYKKLARKNIFRFNYKLLALKELAFHSFLLENYEFKALVVYINERNIFSPILKERYEQDGKEFISFMHGTNLFFLINSFMSFSRYYIWDQDYQELFEKDMLCNINKYKVYTPIKLQHRFEKKEYYDKDITYYLSAQDEKAQKILIKVIKKLRSINVNLLVRPHPRVSMDKKIYPEGALENSNFDIIKSIDQSEYIAGVSTTVIEQAYYGGKKVILDDVTSPEEFESLKSRGYLMLKKLEEKNVVLFSEYLKDKGIEI